MCKRPATPPAISPASPARPPPQGGPPPPCGAGAPPSRPHRWTSSRRTNGSAWDARTSARRRSPRPTAPPAARGPRRRARRRTTHPTRLDSTELPRLAWTGRRQSPSELRTRHFLLFSSVRMFASLAFGLIYPFFGTQQLNPPHCLRLSDPLKQLRAGPAVRSPSPPPPPRGGPRPGPTPQSPAPPTRSPSARCPDPTASSQGAARSGAARPGPPRAPPGQGRSPFRRRRGPAGSSP